MSMMARKNNIKSLSLAKSDKFDLDNQTTTASNLNQLSHSNSHLASEANPASHLIANNDDSDSDFDAHSDTDSDIDENNDNDYNSESTNGTKKNNMCLPFGIAIGVLLIVVLLIMGCSGPKDENNPNITNSSKTLDEKIKFDRKNPESLSQSEGDKKTDNKKTKSDSNEDDKKVESESNPENVIENSGKTESPASETENKKTDEDDKKVASESESENKKADEDDKIVASESESENKKTNEDLDDKKVAADSYPVTVIENSEKTDSPEAETTGAMTTANTEHSEGSSESVDNNLLDPDVDDLSTQNGETAVSVSQNTNVTDAKDEKQKKQNKNKFNLSESSESKKSDVNDDHDMTISGDSDSETTKSKKPKKSSRVLNVVLFVFFLVCAIVFGLLGSGCFCRQTLNAQAFTVQAMDENKNAAITTVFVQPLSWVLFVIFLIAAVYQLGFLVNSFAPTATSNSNNSLVSKTGKNKFVMDNTLKMSNNNANRENDDLKDDSLLRLQKKYDADNDIDHKESDSNLVSHSKTTDENSLDSESQVMNSTNIEADSESDSKLNAESNNSKSRTISKKSQSKKFKQSTFSFVRFLAAVGLIIIGILFITGIGVVVNATSQYSPITGEIEGITHRNFAEIFTTSKTCFDVFSIVVGLVLIIAGTVYLLWSFYGISI